MAPVLPPFLPPVVVSVPAMKSSLMVSQSPAWYRGDHCIVSHGDAIAEDLCYDHPTQPEHCDEGLEDQVECHDAEVDSSICEDCAFNDAKEHEAECHDAEAEDRNFYGTNESHSSVGYRGDTCIVSHGDAIAEDLCSDIPTQLEECAIGDAKEHEVECYDAEEVDCDFGDTKEYEVECYDAEVEDCAFYYTEEYEEESYDADVEECHYY